MAADLILAIDSSTTACKALAWDRRGRVVAEGRASIALENPEPDGWEQDAEDWWRAFCEACRALTAQLDPSRLAAVCITHQRETFVVTDADGRPLRPALVWMDARAAQQVERAKAELGAERLHQLSGKPACTTPSLYKLMYLLEREPGLRTASARVLDVHALLVWRLTGRCATSLAAADPLGLVDMERRSWSQPLCQLAGIATSSLPELVEPGTPIAAVTAEAAAASGLPAGLVVVAGAGDGQCAGLGAGIVAPARAYLNLGTAVVSGVLSPTYRCDLAFRTLYDATGRAYFLETDLQGGTFTISWLIDRWLRRGASPPPFDEVLAELEAEAEKMPPGADGLLLVPYWNGVMNPLWDDQASGVVVGLRGGHGPAHLYRAILEGIALEQRLHTEGVEAATTPVTELVVMGGGSKSALWCQILADALGKPIVRTESSEATALGAGILGAVSAGFFADYESATAAMVRLGERFEPGRRRAAYQRLYDEVYRGLYPSLQGRMQALWRLRG